MSNRLSPTAANIISSLGVKGATVDENLPGHVPVLDETGRISSKLIPADAAQLAIPALSNVAYVDPYTDIPEFSEDDSTGEHVRLRKGSVVAPFKTLSEAAKNFVPTGEGVSSRTIAFMMSPGNYSDSSIEFKSADRPLNVYFIGIGECRFTQSTVSIKGMSQRIGSSNPKVIFSNIITDGTISIVGTPDVTCIGKTLINSLSMSESSGTVKISAESRVSSTNANHVLLADDKHVKNTSSVDGDTVKDALDALGNREVRIAHITIGENGFDIGSSCVDIPATNAGQNDVYDISDLFRTLAEGVNGIIEHARFDVVTANRVVATDIVADVVNAKEVKTGAVTLGGYRIEIDPYGYLVVSNGSVNPPISPDGVFLLRDTSNGATYVFGIADKRLYLKVVSDESSDSSSGPDPYDELEVTDRDTQETYVLYVENGRLMVKKSNEEESQE